MTDSSSSSADPSVGVFAVVDLYKRESSVSGRSLSSKHGKRKHKTYEFTSVETYEEDGLRKLLFKIASPLCLFLPHLLIHGKSRRRAQLLCRSSDVIHEGTKMFASISCQEQGSLKAGAKDNREPNNFVSTVKWVQLQCPRPAPVELFHRLVAFAERANSQFALKDITRAKLDRIRKKMEEAANGIGTCSIWTSSAEGVPLLLVECFASMGAVSEASTRERYLLPIESIIAPDPVDFYEFLDGVSASLCVQDGTSSKNDGAQGSLVDHSRPQTLTCNLSRTLSAPEGAARLQLFGRNAVIVEVQSIFSLFLKEISHPFFVFQILSISLWIYEAYWFYACTILFILLFSTANEAIQLHRNMTKLAELANVFCTIQVVRTENAGRRESRPRVVEIASDQLVPGDVVVIEDHLTLPCDMTLLDGSVIVNEASLTGESCPVRKNPWKQTLQSIGNSATERQTAAENAVRASSHEPQAETRIVENKCVLPPLKIGKEGKAAPYEAKDTLLSESWALPEHVLFAGTQVVQSRGSSRRKKNKRRASETELPNVALAVVTKTGISSVRGSMLSSIIKRAKEKQDVGAASETLYKDAYKVLCGMFCVGVGGIFFCVALFWQTMGPFRGFMLGLDLLTTIVPPALPAAVTFGIVFAVKRLEEDEGHEEISPPGTDENSQSLRKKILCTEPDAVARAGKIDTICFDKTGTLTELGLDVHRILYVQPVGGSEETPLEAARLQENDGSSETVSLSSLSSQNIEQGDKAIFSDPIKGADVHELAPAHIQHIFASCHSLVSVKRRQAEKQCNHEEEDEDELMGDEVDIRLFHLSKWHIVSPKDIGTGREGDARAQTADAETLGQDVERTDEEEGEEELLMSLKPSTSTLGPHLHVHRIFDFSSELARMSVIVQQEEAGDRSLKYKSNVFWAFVKGAPEVIANSCLPSSVPKKFQTLLDKYADQGYRVLAVASKELDVNRSELWKLRRSDVESNLTLQGLVVLENKLKEDTTATIDRLSICGKFRCMMVTGDHIRTAISVGRKSRIVLKEHHLIAIEKRNDKAQRSNSGIDSVSISSSATGSSTHLQARSSSFAAELILRDGKTMKELSEAEVNFALRSLDAAEKERQAERMRKRERRKQAITSPERRLISSSASNHLDESVIVSSAAPNFADVSTDVVLAQQMEEGRISFGEQTAGPPSTTMPVIGALDHSKIKFAITGEALRYLVHSERGLMLADRPKPEDLEEVSFTKSIQTVGNLSLHDILCRGVVFARMSSTDKTLLVRLLKEGGLPKATRTSQSGPPGQYAKEDEVQEDDDREGFPEGVAMCGDGANDAGALQEATIGVSLVLNVPRPKKSVAHSSTWKRFFSLFFGRAMKSHQSRTASGADRENDHEHGESRGVGTLLGAPATASEPSFPNAQPGTEAETGAKDDCLLPGGTTGPKSSTDSSSGGMELIASLAAPFTSHHPSISAVEKVLLEGQCSASASIACFKYMVLYSCVEFTCLLLLYRQFTILSDMQFLYIDLFLVSPLAVLMGRTKPAASLQSFRPPSSLFHPAVVVSAVGHISASFLFMWIALLLVPQASKTQSLSPSPYATTIAPTPSSSGSSGLTGGQLPMKTTVCTVLFLYVNFQYLWSCAALNIGRPFRSSFVTTNRAFLISLLCLTFISLCMLLVRVGWLDEWFEIASPSASTTDVATDGRSSSFPSIPSVSLFVLALVNLGVVVAIEVLAIRLLHRLPTGGTASSAWEELLFIYFPPWAQVLILKAYVWGQIAADRCRTILSHFYAILFCSFGACAKKKADRNEG